MSLRSRLPFIAGEFAGVEDYFGDFLMGGAGLPPIECLQHAPRTRTLLTRQPRVWRDGSVVKRSKQTDNRLDAIESFQSERHDGDEPYIDRGVIRQNEMEMIAAAERMQDVMRFRPDSLVRVGQSSCRDCAMWQDRGRRREYDSACVVFGKPENRSFSSVEARWDGEIAAPSGGSLV